MSTLVFDIETVGEPWDLIDPLTQSSLTRWIDRTAASPEVRGDELQNLKEGLGFSPLTGRIVAIGLYDVERAQGVVFYDTEGTDTEEIDDGEYVLKPRSEAAMLRDFWEGAKLYDTFVTFNGRGFDVPFLLLRSMSLGITPTRDLMEGRYLYQQRTTRHIDLQDQLSFYGAVTRRHSLHLYCRMCGIESPKQEVSGDDVASLFAEGKYTDIARYNARDVRATAELYERWKSTIAPRGLDGGGDV
jgi:DNA polymerase elongation subunit (family B)